MAVAAPLREKLAVPPHDLIAALVSLTSPERQELKNGIFKRATHSSLPGPMCARELCAFLDSIAADHVRRAKESA